MRIKVIIVTVAAFAAFTAVSTWSEAAPRRKPRVAGTAAAVKRVAAESCDLEKIQVARLPELVSAYRQICVDGSDHIDEKTRVADLKTLEIGLTVDCKSEGRAIGACLSKVKEKIDTKLIAAKSCPNCVRTRQELQRETKAVEADLKSILKISEVATSCTAQTRTSFPEKLREGAAEQASCTVAHVFHPLTSNPKCDGKATCLNEVLIQAFKGVKDIGELIKFVAWDAPGAGFSYLGRHIANSFRFGSWNETEKAETLTSNVGQALAHQSAASVKSFHQDKESWLKRWLVSMVDSLKDWVTNDLGCKKWSGSPYDPKSTCLEPLSDFACVPPNEAMNIMCGAVARVVSQTITGDALFGAVAGGAKGLIAMRMARAGDAGIARASEFLAKGIVKNVPSSAAGRITARIAGTTEEAALRVGEQVSPKLSERLVALAKAPVSAANVKTALTSVASLPKQIIVQTVRAPGYAVSSFVDLSHEIGVQSKYLAMRTLGGDVGRAASEAGLEARAAARELRSALKAAKSSENFERAASLQKELAQKLDPSEVSDAIRLRVQMNPVDAGFLEGKALAGAIEESSGKAAVENSSAAPHKMKLEAPKGCGPGKSELTVTDQITVAP